jgi:hypothetical protein
VRDPQRELALFAAVLLRVVEAGDVWDVKYSAA